MEYYLTKKYVETLLEWYFKMKMKKMLAKNGKVW